MAFGNLSFSADGLILITVKRVFYCVIFTLSNHCIRDIYILLENSVVSS